MQRNRASHKTKRRSIETIPSVAAPVETRPARKPATRTFFERYRKPGWFVFSAVILIFYFWTATSGNRPFHPRDTSGEFYNQLTDSLLQGHLYLNQKPSPQLLALPDPYDPTANEKFRLHDATLYRGRYYLYFGIAPVLTLYAPWRMVTGTGLSDDVAVTIFSMAGYVFSCLLLFLLLEAAHIRPPWFLEVAAVFAVGLGQIAPIVLRRPRVYEVAVSAAYCFLLGGLYFLARRVLKTDTGRWLPALAAIFMGLAVASRPHCVLAVFVAVIYYGFHLKRTLGLSGRSWVIHFAVFLFPLGIAGTFLALYNYLRFDNPFEFGLHYQLTVINLMQDVRNGVPPATRLKSILSSVYYFLLCPPDFLRRFPFLELSPAAQPFGDPSLPPGNYFQEPVGSILMISPLCIAGFALPFLPWKQKPIVGTVLRILMVCGLATFVGVCSVPSASARYELDFVPVFAIAGLFVCLWIHAQLPTQKTRTVMAALTLAGCAWAGLVTSALSVNSYGYPLEQSRSATFRSIASFFGAGPDAFMNDVLALHLDATVVIPRVKPPAREALLATGMHEKWDLLFVTYAENDTVEFSYVHSGVSYALTPAMHVTFGAPQHLVVDYSAAANKIVVRLNDQTIIDFPTTFFPTSPDRLTLGSMRAGRFRLRDFSGSIDPAPGNPLLQLRHVVPPAIYVQSPAADSLTPLGELYAYDLDALISHSEQTFYGGRTSPPPDLPAGVFLTTSARDHFATGFQSTAAAGSLSASAVEINATSLPHDDRFGSINMHLQDQDFRTLYRSGSLPSGDEHIIVALPAGTRAVRLVFLPSDEGYINFPKTLRVRTLRNK